MGKKNTTTTTPLTDVQKQQIKRDNFARVLPPRMDKALKAIRMVGECTLPTYSYTTVQAEAVMTKLQAAVTEVMERFTGKQGKAGGFELPG